MTDFRARPRWRRRSRTPRFQGLSAITDPQTACKLARVTVKSLRGVARVHKFRFVGMHQEISQRAIKLSLSLGQDAAGGPSGTE